MQWLKRRLSRHNGKLARFLAGMTLLVPGLASGVMLFWVPGQACQVHALALPDPAAFCYGMPITIANTSGGLFTNKVVIMTLDASFLESQGYLQRHGWDFIINDSNSVDADTYAEDVTSTTALWPFVVHTLPDTESINYTMFLGSDTARRNNGLLMNLSANTKVEHVHDALFDVTDAFRLTVRPETTSSIGTYASPVWLASHGDGTDGYRIGVIDVGGVRKIRANVKTQNLDVTWDGTLKTISMTFQNPTLTVFYDGVSQGTLNTGLASVTTLSTAFTGGASFEGALRYTELDDGLGSGENVIMRWVMDAEHATEVSFINPTLTATIADAGGNGLDGTYTLDSDQTGVTITIGPVFNQFSDAGLKLSSKLGTNVIGNGSSASVLAPSGGAKVPGNGVISGLALSLNFDPQVMWLILIIPFCIIAMPLTGMVSSSAWFGMAIPSPILFGAALMGVISFSPGLAYTLVMVGVYGLIRSRA